MKRCSDCNLCFEDEVDLAKHIDSHEPSKIVKHTYQLSNNTCNLIMMDYFNRRIQKSVMCDDCGKVILSKNLKRHRNVCKKNDKNNHSELNVGCTLSDLRNEVMHESKLYDENIFQGEMIWNMIRAGEIKEESLSKKNRHYLKLYLRSTDE